MAHRTEQGWLAYVFPVLPDDLTATVRAEHADWPLAVDLRIDTAGVVRGVTVGEHPEVARPPGGITTRLVRSLPLGEITTAARRALEIHAWLLSETAASHPTARSLAASAERFTVRPGRAGRDDAEYAQLAAVYVSLLDEERPLMTLAQRLHLSESQVRNLLYEARRRDLLTKAPPGRAGGSLTDKSRAILQEVDHG